MLDWNFYKDYYKIKYEEMLIQFKKKIDEAEIKITKDNILEYFDEEGWISKTYKCEEGILLLQGKEYNPIDIDYPTYVITKEFYSGITISYNLNLDCLCTIIKEKIKHLYNEEVTNREIIKLFGFQDWILRLK